MATQDFAEGLQPYSDDLEKIREKIRARFGLKSDPENDDFLPNSFDGVPPTSEETLADMRPAAPRAHRRCEGWRHRARV